MAQAHGVTTITATRSATFERFAGVSGVVVGLCSLLYAVFFLTNDLKSLWVLVPGALASLLATPIWNIWLGLRFLRNQ